MPVVRFARLRLAGVPGESFDAIMRMRSRSLRPRMIRGHLDEKAIEDWINDHLLHEDKALLAKGKTKRLELGGRLSGDRVFTTRCSST